MKKLLITLIALTLWGGPSPTAMAQPGYEPSAENLAARQRFAQRRFGIFLHWGIYSLFGQGEWYMTNAGIDCHEYAKAASAFYPHAFDADAWIKAFKDAGAGYICFTTRHHDGFSMWDTKTSDYQIMSTPYGRDIVSQLARACHEQDMGLHLYYSHLDWTREDYPLGRTGRNTHRRGGMENRTSYFNFVNQQLTELLTNYGRVDAIWFDGMWDHDNDKTPFDWNLDEQYALIHRLQPACLIGNNHHQTPYPGEDIQLFERDVPGENKAGFSGQAVSRLPLETCQTMNGMWGYKVADQDYKSSAELIRLLARTASKGANLLLNIGPQPDGHLPAQALDRLRDMGAWLRANGESIYGTEGADFAGTREDVVCTQTKEAVYLHVLNPSLSRVDGLSIPRKVKKAYSLTDGTAFRLNKVKKGQYVVEGINAPADCADYVVVLK